MGGDFGPVGVCGRDVHREEGVMWIGPEKKDEGGVRKGWERIGGMGVENVGRQETRNLEKMEAGKKKRR